MNPDRLLEHYETFSEAEDAVPRLRQFILELAVRGKLVEQNSEDEPAQILIERGQETESFQKTSGVENVLPRGWRRVFLGRLISLRKGKKPKALNAAGRGLPYLDIAALERGDIRQFAEDAICPRATADDLVIVCDGSRSGLVLDGRDGVLGSTVAAIQFNGFTRGYLRVLLNALYEDLNGSKKGAAIPHLNIPRLFSLEIGLPPPTEQHRIVAKVDELMSLCDELEAARTKRETRRDRLISATLHHLNNGDASTKVGNGSDYKETARFYFNHLPRLMTRPEHIKRLRQTILNLAVRGKLVPQDPSDEPASELLKRIQAEKAGLVKISKRKKSIALSPIDDIRAPFPLPRNWAWARFPELGVFGRGKSKHRPRNDRALFIGGSHLLVQTGDVARSKGNIETYTNKYNDVGLAQSVKWPKGTLCITIAANIADSGILGFDACFPDSVVGFIPASVFPGAKYFEYFIRTAKVDLLKFAPSTAQKNINLEILNAVLIPLPPLAELQRIVMKMDELMALCDELEVQFTTTATTRRQLLEATLHEALSGSLEHSQPAWCTS